MRSIEPSIYQPSLVLPLNITQFSLILSIGATIPENPVTVRTSTFTVSPILLMGSCLAPEFNDPSHDNVKTAPFVGSKVEASTKITSRIRAMIGTFHQP